MIKNAQDIRRVKARWTGDQTVLRRALTVLDAATCQQEVENALQPPISVIGETLQPPVYALQANGRIILRYSLVETRRDTQVTLLP